MNAYESARLHIETGGSIECALDMTGEQILDELELLESASDMSDMHAEQWQTRALNAEAALARVRALANDHRNSVRTCREINAALDGDS